VLVHNCNEESQRGKATALLCERIPWVWLLTGTPVTKRPRNLIHLLKLIRHPLVNTSAKVWNFLTRYCGEKDEWGRWDFNRAKNLDELHALLQDVLIRRERSQTNRPAKVRQIETVHLTPAQRATYDNAWEDYLAKPGNREKTMRPGYPTAMVQTMVNRYAVSMAKVPIIIDWAEDLIVAEKKVVIFTCFDDVFEAYAKHFGKRAVGIRGKVSPEDRATAVRRFQNDPDIDAIICNILAAKEAIPLWAGYALAFNDLSWLPGDQLQAEDRIVGGDKTSCFITFFLAENTADQHGFADFIKHKDIVQRIVNRRDDNGKVIDPGFVSGMPEVITRATEGAAGRHDKEMTKLGRLADSNSLKPGDTVFAESLLTQYASKGTLSDKQAAVVIRMLSRYKDRLAALGVD
jgi:SWI/SNF-related matrix-associated actin-dependent regulator 1 of chromatin subfamily A